MEKGRSHRLTEWWRPKAGTIFSLLLFYLALWNVPFEEGCKLLFFSAVALIGFGLFGYFLNDLADIEGDRKVGKPNLVDGIPSLLKPLLFLLTFGFAILPWLVYFKVDAITIVLIIAQIIVQVAYPLPPLRLKRFPVAAILADSLYAFAIPALLALHTFEITSKEIETSSIVHLVFVFCWMLAMGLRHILNHHLADRFNDLKTSTPNLVNDKSPYQIRRFLESTVFPVELAGSFGFFMCLMNYSQIKPLAPMALIIVAAAGHWASDIPFFRVPFARTRMDRFSSHQLAVVSLAMLALQDWQYIMIVAIFLLLFTNLPTHPLIRNLVATNWTNLLEIPSKVYSAISLIVNWALYFFRKWVLGWSEERNWGKHYQKRLLDLHLKERGVVAIFNWNFQKFSETYVQQQKAALDYPIEYYYGYAKPLFRLRTGHLVHHDVSVRNVIYAWLNLLNVDIDSFESSLIVRSLQRTNTRIIVAHFGTMGAILRRVSVESGIPMVVLFHGYDAWSHSQLQAHKSEYEDLFKVAAAIIGVSKEICSQLEILGCEKHKIHYLPAYFDLAKFPYEERSNTEVVTFLSVGRFSKTKSPLFLITAFSEVLKKCDNVRLIMVGADDGEQLFEVSVMHSMTLGVRDQIEFKGALSAEDVRSEMANASVFVQHSVTTPLDGDKEGTPVSVMEAMATGLPVLATRHAGIAEMIENNVSGILVDEYDLNSMVEKMIVLATDHSLRVRIGKCAAESIRKNEHVKDNLLKFSAILDNHKLAK